MYANRRRPLLLSSKRPSGDDDGGDDNGDDNGAAASDAAESTTTTTNPLLLRRRPTQLPLPRHRSSSTMLDNGDSNKRRRLCVPIKKDATRSSKLFRRGSTILVQRVPLLSGLSVSNQSVVAKKFRRPMLKRRAYGKAADSALRHASLGQRVRRDGMAKIMARAGKGLDYKGFGIGPNKNRDEGDTESGGSSRSDSDDEKDDEDRPFEPLLLWTSPHQGGGEPRGLPPRVVVERRPDEFGILEDVPVRKAAPAELYSRSNVFVPTVLAKWLRPHQREGVQFMYECVMGLKDFQGNGCILADDMGTCGCFFGVFRCCPSS